MSKFINYVKWSDVTDIFNWISLNDEKYYHIKNNVINPIFESLWEVDKTTIMEGLIKVINFLAYKYYLNNKEFWNQLCQNDFMDIRALLTLILPFIDDDENNTKKRNLTKLSDIYLSKDSSGKYIYNNSQYNRCIRYKDYNDPSSKTKVSFRPYLKEYFDHNLEILLMSMEQCTNKMYVNWVDVIPVPMTKFEQTDLYLDTIQKKKAKSPTLINNYIDKDPGLSYNDIYNTVSNHLYTEIKTVKWLIYDIFINNKPETYISYLESILNLTPIWNFMSWSQLTDLERDQFQKDWLKFLNNTNIIDNTILTKFYYFFATTHVNSELLISSKKLILTSNISTTDEINDEESRATKETTRNAKLGMQNVPINEIYLFLLTQLRIFSKTWFYYIIKIKKVKYLEEINTTVNGTPINLFVTPKNVYNYSKSMIHFTATSLDIGKDKYFQIPSTWTSLPLHLQEMFLVRFLDIRNSEVTEEYLKVNDWNDINWFSINNYFRIIYDYYDDLPILNYLLSVVIQNNLIKIIFESMIFHGLLSEFRPNHMATDMAIVNKSMMSENDYKRTQISKFFTTDDYSHNSYYYVTGQPYDRMVVRRNQKYIDYLQTGQIWAFTYAMNWVSQINFFHHFANCRVMYITGSTGVGKSSQTPKLLMYSQKMIDYNSLGKTICTQPRIKPTVDNAEFISLELGVPIRIGHPDYECEVYSNNYSVQYKYADGSHMNNSVSSFLRIVTDGTLLEEFKSKPFMTKASLMGSVVDDKKQPATWIKSYSATNYYDTIIVDEAHEHNVNMDMILTLARDATYVNNSLRLVIISATIDDDEPIYRRYYRSINDNRAYPLSNFIQTNNLDRSNIDRRIHISPPGKTTKWEIVHQYLPEQEDYITQGANESIKTINTTTEGHILLFLTKQKEIDFAVQYINKNTSQNIIALPFYKNLEEDQKKIVDKLYETLPLLTRYKEDILLPETSITRRLPQNTYTRAIIVATNIAEASITIKDLKFVIDSGKSQVQFYDPITDMSYLTVVPISASSATQRAGRVGRTEPGTVIHLYPKEKLISNKTIYNITNIDVSSTLTSLIKDIIQDSPIIYILNDINNIETLDLISKKANYNTFRMGIDNMYFSEILKNPIPYIRIILKNYMNIPDPGNLHNFYTYYGKSNKTLFSPSIPDFINYCTTNHDDYANQPYLTEFISRDFSGYRVTTLEDDNLNFYLIHPDENIINRNPYTGDLISINKTSQFIDPSYYSLIHTIRTNDTIQTIFPKTHIALNKARMQMNIIDIPSTEVDSSVYFYLLDSQTQEYIAEYYTEINELNNQQEFITVKSPILSKAIALKKIIDSSDEQRFTNNNSLLWFTFSIPYNLENDVIALQTLIKMVNVLEEWITQGNNLEADIKYFKSIHHYKDSDLALFWEIWMNIKKILTDLNIFSSSTISVELESEFNSDKSRYLSSLYIPYEKYLIIDKLYKNGQINTEHDFYYFIKNITNQNLVINPTLVENLKHIATKYKIDNFKLMLFIKEYLSNITQMNKNIWLYEYETKNNMNTRADNETETEIENSIQSARESSRLPGYITDHNYIPTPWDLMLETYIRSHSSNIAKNYINYYLKFSDGFQIQKNIWILKRQEIERTLLQTKFEYIIYNNIANIKFRKKQKTVLNILTNVRIEWVMRLNPIYYYLMLFSTDTFNLYKPTKNMIESMNIIKDLRHKFDFNALYAYLEVLDIPIVTEMINKTLSSTKASLH